MLRHYRSIGHHAFLFPDSTKVVRTAVNRWIKVRILVWELCLSVCYGHVVLWGVHSVVCGIQEGSIPFMLAVFEFKESRSPSVIRTLAGSSPVEHPSLV